MNLTRDTSRELEAVHNIVGSQQVAATKLYFAPPWLLQDSLNKEHDSNWEDAYVEVEERDVPRSTNVISSHVVRISGIP